MAVKMFCQACNVQMIPKKKTKGSFFIEILLWLLIFPIGIIYTLWRLCSKVKVCPSCGQENCFIPINTPAGRKLMNQIKSTPEKNIDIASHLQKLGDLKEKGLITEEEFIKEKTKYLG